MNVGASVRSMERNSSTAVNEVRASVAFVELFEDRVVHRFDGAGYEEATGPLQSFKKTPLLEQVFDLDGGVVGEDRKFVVQRLDDPHGVAWVR